MRREEGAAGATFTMDVAGEGPDRLARVDNRPAGRVWAKFRQKLPWLGRLDPTATPNHYRDFPKRAERDGASRAAK